MKELYTLHAPCHFGLEAVLRREIQDLGYEVTHVEDGKVTFSGDAQAIAYANVFLRTTERVLLDVGTAKVLTWDELFEATRAMPWERYIPKDGKFWVVKANAIKSRLFSSSDIQSIVKKAIVERLKQVYGVEWFAEDGASYPIRVNILKDVATLSLDTSGASLHKRGYRKLTAKAPITETLAAALLLLTPWGKNRILVDPMCGSGTFPIEAAMIACNMAPGRNRHFTAENWGNIMGVSDFADACEEADEGVTLPEDTDIQGFDMDGEIIHAARENAKLAGVDGMIHFQQRELAKLSHPKKYGFLVTNPPYGERLEDKENLPELYRTLGERFAALSDWSMYVITSYSDAQKYIGRQADKNRKIYNGMLKTYFYQYLGPKPPRRRD